MWCIYDLIVVSVCLDFIISRIWTFEPDLNYYEEKQDSLQDHFGSNPVKEVVQQVKEVGQAYRKQDFQRTFLSENLSQEI